VISQHRYNLLNLLLLILLVAFLAGVLSLFRPPRVYADTGRFIVKGDIWNYFKGLEEPPADWNIVGFNDSGWSSGPTSIGYGDDDDATVLDDMQYNYVSVYMRRTFDIVDPTLLFKLLLRIDYDDGYVAYLNGAEVARHNLGKPGTPVPHSATATSDREAGIFETVDISDYLEHVVTGTNVLTIQVHNISAKSTDLSIVPELHWIDDTEDLSDTLLLYAARYESPSDSNFRKISEYYGLKWSTVDLSTDVLNKVHLQDESGEYYRAIGISEYALVLLDSSELALLEEAVDVMGANLFIAGLSEPNQQAVEDLTDGEITGGRKPDDSTIDFIISDQLIQVSREFSGQSLNDFGSYEQIDYALELGENHLHVQPIISSTDDFAAFYHIFASYKAGAGRVFVQGRNNGFILGDQSNYYYYYMNLLYRPKYLTEITPLMMFMRYAAGDKVWHREQNYANFSIDDAPLVCDDHEVPCHWRTLYWSELLKEMQAYDFHTTIAFIPKNYQTSETEVINLFLNNPDYYSLVFHGNNHDNGLPFPDNCPEFSPDISLAEKEDDLVEAKWRMQQHESATGIPCDTVMVFPCQLSGIETLDLLKKHNFNVTVNAKVLPIDAEYGSAWDFGMYPAYIKYKNFAVVKRYELRYGDYISSQEYIFDLFLDRPLLLFEHAQDPWYFFKDGMDAFNSYAETINSLEGNIKWKSLGYITRRLYLEKRNNDGSMDIKMHGNNLILENQSEQDQTYHVRREENFSYPFRVLIDAQIASYSTTEEEVVIVLTIPPYSEREVLIDYDYENRTASISGVVYEDVDNDGIFSTGDTPLNNAVVTLSNDLTITTGTDGAYQFTGLIPGCYTVKESDPLGYTSVMDAEGDNDNSIFVVLSSGKSVVELNFLDRYHGLCPMLLLYTQFSEEIKMLRSLRDNVLNKTPEGQEIIRIYYEWSPLIVHRMEKDSELKKRLKEIVNEVLVVMGEQYG